MSKVIVLDAGHGMNTPGKRTPKFTDGTKSELTGKNFMNEHEFNSSVVEYMKPELERMGFKVVITTSFNEKDVSLAERCRISDRNNADLFVSVHANALKGYWNSARGIETYTWRNGESVKVGTILNKKMVEVSGLYDRGVKDGSWIYVIKNQKAPSVLVECGFMDNLKEAKLLLSDEYRRRIAKSLVIGICEHYGVNYTEPEPKKEKQAENKPISWKLKDLQELHAAGIVDDFDGWAEKIDEPAPNWLVFILMNRVRKELMK